MNAGIDFGTSTCSIGVWKDGQPDLLKLEGDSTRLTSALHTTRPGIAVGTAPDADSEITFGEEAVRQHLLDPQQGYFVKSPKSFLGADIKQQHVDLFAAIIARMLAHIKRRAEEQVEGTIDAICLGRPVRFHGLRGEEGNRQAVAIMERAAVAAGFKYVEFMFEPIAAALDYERGISRDVVALILDAGGGTTDCSMVRIGPTHREQSSRVDSVLGYSGDRLGGTDIDIRLVIRKVMPHFGKDTLLNSGLPIPNSIYWNAATVNDVNALAEFTSERTGRELGQLLADAQEKRKVTRLLALYRGRHNYRLNRSAELAKIALSEHETTSLPLDYIEPELAIPLSRADLRESVERELGKIVELMREVAAQAQTAPDVIYVTGGTARSPMILECLRANFGGVDIVVGDLFGSVTSGLATWAQRTFR